MKILLISDGLELGGVDLCVLRLARSLKLRGIEIGVYCPFHFRVNKRVTNNFNNVTMYYYQPGKILDFIINKIDGLIKKLNMHFYFRRHLSYSYIKKLFAMNEYDVVHSHLFHSAIIAARLKAHFGCPHVHTLHGGIDGYSFKIVTKKDMDFDGVEKTLRRIFESVDTWIYHTDKNLIVKELMKILGTTIDLNSFVKIYNVSESITPGKINSGNGSIRFAFVGRGEGPVVGKKGLEFALKAFVDGEFHDRAMLYVYSEGDYVNNLKKLYCGNKGIFFSGYTFKHSVIYENTDVGLFPSIANESFPTVVTEFLCNGIPVIATDVGECRKLLTQDEHAMGFVISVDKDKHLFLKKTQDEEFIIAELKNYMNKYCNDRTLLNEHRANTEYINKIIDENDIVQRHMEVYGKSV